MLTASCNDCKKPISASDNHFNIPQFIIVDGGKQGDARNLHFCGQGCLVSWLAKGANRPNVISSPFGPSN